MGCSRTNQKKAIEDISNAYDSVIQNKFKTPVDSFPTALRIFQDQQLEQIISQGEIEFESDTSFQLNRSELFEIDYGWKVFLSHGVFLPSNADFSFYGGYVNVNNIVFKIYHLPIETNVYFTRYEASPTSLYIFGVLENENSETREDQLLMILNK